MSSDSKPSSRPDLDSARLGMKSVLGAPPVGGSPTEGPDGTFHDRDGPSGPPNPKVKQIPPHLKKIINFFQGLIADEGLLLEMCFDHCMTIVSEGVNSKAAGADFFAGPNGDGGSSFTPGHYATVAGPMACELYKQVLLAVKDREADYSKLLEEATREREKNAPNARPSIIIASAK